MHTLMWTDIDSSTGDDERKATIWIIFERADGTFRRLASFRTDKEEVAVQLVSYLNGGELIPRESEPGHTDTRLADWTIGDAQWSWWQAGHVEPTDRPPVPSL